MTECESTEPPSRLKVERDLYRRLLELGREAALEPFLRDSLALVVGLTGAQQAYLELYSGAPVTHGRAPATPSHRRI